MMISATINNKIYYIPEKWEDMLYRDAVAVFVAYHNQLEDVEVISRACLVPVDVLNNCETKSIKALMRRIAFINDLRIFESKDVKPEYKDFDYGSLKYGKSEQVRQLMDSNKTMYENAPAMFKFLFDVDVNDKPFTEWIGTVNFFLNTWFSSSIASDLYKKVSTLTNRSKPESGGLSDSEPLVLT